MEDMLRSIPATSRKRRRIPDQWSIQEWACHLIDSQDFLLDRFVLVRQNPDFEIPAHLPDFRKIMTDYLEKDLDKEILVFHQKRMNMINSLRTYDEAFFKLSIKHQEYRPYTPFDLLRHILFIDHVHLFHIEKLWLTKDQYL